MKKGQQQYLIVERNEMKHKKVRSIKINKKVFILQYYLTSALGANRHHESFLFIFVQFVERMITKFFTYKRKIKKREIIMFTS